jgi:hypothetical protein
MSSIEQAGLIIIAVIALMVIGARGSNRGPRIRDEDADTWWHARRSWWNDRR